MGELLGDLGEIVQNNDRTHADLQMIHDEYKMLVGGSAGLIDIRGGQELDRRVLY